MKGLVIFWDPHVDYLQLIGGAKRWLSTYIFTMETFDFDTLFVVGKPGIQHGYSIKHTEHESLEEILDYNKEVTFIALTGEAPDGIVLTKLNNYIYPSEDVIYIIGGDYMGLDFSVLSYYNVDYIKISGVIDNPNLWSHTVAAIVMNDYFNKQWQ